MANYIDIEDYEHFRAEVLNNRYSCMIVFYGRKTCGHCKAFMQPFIDMSKSYRNVKF